MGHKGKGGNKSKPQRTAKYARHFALAKEMKARRKKKWNRDRERWANDKDYQMRQNIRDEKLGRVNTGKVVG